jgi:hypothetical protein
MASKNPSRKCTAHGKPPAADRRSAVRYSCLHECLVRIEGAPAGGDWPGMVYNVSARGIGLALPFPAPAGAVLVIERRTARRSGTVCRARVVRCRLESYVWFHGCTFLDPLGAEELAGWVEELGAKTVSG